MVQELVEEEQALELVEQDQHKQENRKPRQQKKARRKQLVFLKRTRERENLKKPEKLTKQRMLKKWILKKWMLTKMRTRHCNAL